MATSRDQKHLGSVSILFCSHFLLICGAGYSFDVLIFAAVFDLFDFIRILQQLRPTPYDGNSAGHVQLLGVVGFYIGKGSKNSVLWNY